MSYIESLTKNYNLRLAVCIPARDQMHTATSYCLWQLCSLLKSQGIETKLFVSLGTLIVDQRQELVLSAKEWNATHVLFIDSDIEFEAESVLNLIAHKTMVAAGCYSKRVEPFINTAWYKIDDWDSWVRIKNDSTGLIEVAAVSLGFALIEMSVFDQLSDPWFELGYQQRHYLGEDIEFCRKLNQAKIKILLDLDVSKKIKHLGVQAFSVLNNH